MNKIIQQLIDIENNAQTIIKDANDMEHDLDKIVDQRICEIKENIDKKVEDRIESIDSFESEDAKNRVEELRSKLNEEKEKLIETDNEKHEIWVNKIYDEIIALGSPL